MELLDEQFKQLVKEAAHLTRVTDELNAEWFKDQVAGGASKAAAAAGTGASAASTEKRAATRIRVRYAVSVRLANKPAAPPFRATMFDVSHAGVGLVCPVPMNGQFTLEMPNQYGIIYAVTCVTRSCRPLGANAGFAVGASFVDPVQGAAAA